MHKLGFEYKDVKKDVFVAGHERPDVVKDREEFLQTMRDLELCLVEFNPDGTMKPKQYPDDCFVEGEEPWPCASILALCRYPIAYRL